MPNAPDLSIVIVSWNVRELLRRCIESVWRSLEGSGLSAEVIVVDNDSADSSEALARQLAPAVRVIQTGANLGYSGGVNVGLRAATGRLIAVLNPDTEMVADALPVLARYLDQHPEVSVVGPTLRYPDGSLQSSRRRLPSLAMLLWESTILAKWWPSNPWQRRFQVAERPDDAEQPVGWLVGAALLVRAADVERVGPMDERFWMFSEELEWQRRLGRGRQIVYVPSAVIIHHEGQSTAQVPARKHIAFQSSKLRYAHITYGLPGALLLLAVLLVGYALEWLTEAAKLLLGHKRQLRRDRMRVYVQVFQALAGGAGLRPERRG